MSEDALTYSETRFACRCGRFLSESAIRCEDYRDDSSFYGVSTHVEWDCSRCGTVKGEGAWEPQIVVLRESPLRCWCKGEVGPRTPGGIGCLENITHDWLGSEKG